MNGSLPQPNAWLFFSRLFASVSSWHSLCLEYALHSPSLRRVVAQALRHKPCLNSSAVSAHWGQVVLPQPLPGSPLTTSPHGARPVRLLALSARLWSQPTYFTSSHACLYRWDLLPSLVHLRGISFSIHRLPATSYPAPAPLPILPAPASP